MKNWESDKKWSDKFLPEIKQLLGLYLINEAPIEEDRERNTDLIVLKMEAVRIGCRIRRNKYLAYYGNEFTIREGRPSNIKTELTKIIEGWGNYFFYGFADESEAALAKWALCDMNIFRLWFNRSLVNNSGIIPGIAKNNKDNSSSFRVFKFSELPNNFIVAS